MKNSGWEITPASWFIILVLGILLIYFKLNAPSVAQKPLQTDNPLQNT
jgi:hypothetical protein